MSHYHVPKCDGARRHLRDTAIREDFDRMTATMTARAAMMELARGSGLTSRRVDEATAGICARLHIPDRAPENDSWIAATAKQHGLTLATRNVKDMRHAGIKLFDPFA